MKKVEKKEKFNKTDLKNDGDDVLTSAEVCQLLQISYATFITFKKEIPFIRVGKGYRYFKKDIIAYLEKKKNAEKS